MICTFLLAHRCARESCEQDLLDIELVNDTLKTFDHGEENLVALERGPAADLLEGLHHRQLEKSTLMLHASAQYHSAQVHHKEPKSFSRLKALVTDVLKDQQQHSVKAQQHKGQVQDRAIPVAPVKHPRDVKRGDCKQWS